MDTMKIYIDDTGQLHPNYPHGDIFIYAGFWTTDEQDDAINKQYGILRQQFFKTKSEVKGSSMKEKARIKIIRRLKNKFPDGFHPIFVAVKVKDLDIDFSDKQAVQLHKNYLLRRFVEEAIKDKRLKLGMKLKKVQIFIDDQSKTRLPNFDSLEKYINNSAKGNRYFNPYTQQSAAEFSVFYEDSKYNNGIQIADILANTKGHYYNSDAGLIDVKEQFQKLSIPAPLKLPTKWTIKTID